MWFKHWNIWTTILNADEPHTAITNTNFYLKENQEQQMSCPMGIRKKKQNKASFWKSNTRIFDLREFWSSCSPSVHDFSLLISRRWENGQNVIQKSRKNPRLMSHKGSWGMEIKTIISGDGTDFNHNGQKRAFLSHFSHFLVWIWNGWWFLNILGVSSVMRILNDSTHYQNHRAKLYKHPSLTYRRLYDYSNLGNDSYYVIIHYCISLNWK